MSDVVLVRVTVIPEGEHVSAVTSLGDDVFVGRGIEPNFKKIEVYDAKTQRHITVLGLGCCLGLAACGYNRCLYASDYDNDKVYRVELESGSDNAVSWPVVRSPANLSVNSHHDLIVVSRYDPKLQIYSTDGLMLQDIQLQADIEFFINAVQLPTGDFVVIYGNCIYSGYHVCLVDVDGALVRNYLGQLQLEAGGGGLAVDRDGRVLVAINSNKLLMMDPLLTTAREMRVEGLNQPVGL